MPPNTASPPLDRATELLRDSSVFRGLPQEVLETLAGMARVVMLSAGAVLMREGDPAECLYVLAAGRVRVSQKPARPAGEELTLAMLGPGEVVGEMGLLDGEPRSATLTAVEPTTALELPAETIAMAVLQYPSVSSALLRTVSQRLRDANQLARRIAETRGDRPAAR